MFTRIVSLLMALLMLAMPVASYAESNTTYDVTLPADYETSGLNYPVIYVMPQRASVQEAVESTSMTVDVLVGMENGLCMDAIVVSPVFAADTDVVAAMNAIIAEVDGAYRTIPDAAHRAVVGYGAGGYLAYTLALEETNPYGFVGSIRGDFASEANPWLPVYGDVYAKMEAKHAADPAAFDAFYTYMDAPVDDAWTNMTGSTNDLGSLMIGFGTGSAFHEFTVRPGSFDQEFIAESVSRMTARLTANMVSGIATGSVKLAKSAITAQDAEAQAAYTVNVTEALAAYAQGEVPMDVIVSVVENGQIISTSTAAHTVTGAGEYTGEATIPNNITGGSATVVLSVSILGVTNEVAAVSLISVQDPIVDGDWQQIDLMGDWYFNYVGAQTVLDVAALTPAEYESWSVVQPGLTSWTKGFGNISDENVVSGYGPDYFDYFIVGSGYYAKTFTVPENFDAKELVLSAGYVDDRCEVYLNGVKVGETGMANGEPTGDTTWAVFSNFEIDPAIVNVGGENTMVVRAWNDLPFGAGGWYGGPIGLYSKTAFDAQYAEGNDPRFYEASFESAHVAAALGQTGTVENKYLIYLPEGYEDSDRRYPTVYLLHQFNSDHTSYRTDKVNQLLDAGIAAGLFDEMIVVIPNSSEDSWWAGEWEKMVTDELIPLIDSEYRTIQDARYRLTAGCSMGGQGAYSVALRNPDYFSGAISFFGAFSYGGQNSPNAIAAAESAEYMDYFTLYFICGNQDSYGFGVPAIELNQQLEELGIEHRFFIDNGGHDSTFYVPFFHDAFSYVRANMYKSDEAIDALLTGSAALEGTSLTVEVTADPAIAAYMNTIPASSYTVNAAPALTVALLAEVEGEGVTARYTATGITITPEDLTESVVIPVAEIEANAATSITLKAQIFDRVVTLATIEIPAK